MTTPQLERYACGHLLFGTTCILHDGILDRLRTETSPDRATTRTIEWKWEALPTNAHFIYSQAHLKLRGPKTRRLYEIQFHYDLTERPQRRADVKASSRLDRVISVLEDLGEEAIFTCDASFQYDESTARKLFPMKPELPQGSEGLFNEIRGLTMVKTENGREIYRVAINSEDLKAVALDAYFAVRRPFGKDLLDQILEQANLLASKFIVQETA